MNVLAAHRLLSALGEKLPVEENPIDSVSVHESLWQASERLRWDNTHKIIRYALAITGGPVPDTCPAPSWLLRYLHEAGTIAAPELHDLWARILAYEILRPGTTSVSTLAVAARLGVDDVERLKRLAALVMREFVVRTETTSLESRGLDGGDLLLLEEIGLLLPGDQRGKVFPSQSSDHYRAHLSYGNRVIRVEHPFATRLLTLPIHALTRAGRELASLLPVAEDHGYLMEVTAMIRDMGYHVTHATIVERTTDPDVIRHSGFIEIVPFQTMRRKTP